MLSQRLRSPGILDATPYLHAGYRCCAACAFTHLYTSFPNWRHGEACAKDKNLYPVWGDDTIWKMLGQLCLVPEQIILSLLKHLRRGYYAGPLYGVLGFSHFWAGTISPGTVCHSNALLKSPHRCGQKRCSSLLA